MKNIYLIITISLASIFLVSCGGNGDGEFDTGSTIVSVVDCNTSTYTAVQSNDLLVKDTDNTTVKIVHDANGTKTICVLTGSAHIVRDN